MSYSAYDQKGYVGDAASINGWNEFAAWAEQQGGELALLAASGEASDLPALITQTESVKADNATIESTRANLVELMKKANETFYISQEGE